MTKALPIDIEAKISSKEREYFEYNGVRYDVTWGNDNPILRHGGPFDRGSADSYYRRQSTPHYFVGNTGTSEKITEENMTSEQIDTYWAGYYYNEKNGDFKEY